jgi:hypothetical protein
MRSRALPAAACLLLAFGGSAALTRDAESAAAARPTPLVKLTVVPPRAGTARSVHFRWAAKHARITCRLLRLRSAGTRALHASAFHRCSSPKSWKGLATARYRFELRAVARSHRQARLRYVFAIRNPATPPPPPPPGPPPPPPPVPASFFLSPSGSDANPCTPALPCLSFDRAYHLARPGQVVEVAAGTYGDQNVNDDPSKTAAADVVFRPASGARVSLGSLEVYGSHVTFQGMMVNGDWQTYHGTDDVTFRNVTVDGEILTQSSSNISVIGGSVGGTVDTKSQFGNWPLGTNNRNILVDGVTFHDVTRSSSGVHVECLLVGGTNGFVLRNSRFSNCDVFDVSIGQMNDSSPPSNVTVENNFFGGSNGYFSFDINTTTASLSNVLIRNNSSPQEMYLGNALPLLTNVRVVGNIAPISAANCETRILYSHNVWQGGVCSATDVNAPAGFRNASALDLHLVPGSAAIGRGDPASYPATDIDGQARPRGALPDAGADEAG